MNTSRYISKGLQFIGLAFGLSGLILVGIGLIATVFILGVSIVGFFSPTVESAFKYLWMPGLYCLLGFIAVYSSKWCLALSLKFKS